MKITVKNLNNEEVGEVEVPEAVFGCPYKEHLIHTVVRAVLAARRAGTHKTKVRSEVAGTGRKLWRQKGTGRARMGSPRSPIWRKGGTVHGPQPRSYELGVSVGEKKGALKSALSRKLADGEILVLDSLLLESHKTKVLEKQIAGLGAGKKTLLVDSRENDNLLKAACNNPRLKTIDARAINVYDIVERDHVVFSQTALEKMVEVLGR